MLTFSNRISIVYQSYINRISIVYQSYVYIYNNNIINIIYILP